MKFNRLFALVVVVCLAVAPTMIAAPATVSSELSFDVKATPSKVCHPKKPVTCRAADLSTVTDVTLPALEAAATLTASAEEVGMICMGSRFFCRSGKTLAAPSFEATPAVTAAPVVSIQARSNEVGMICMGSRFFCKSANVL